MLGGSGGDGSFGFSGKMEEEEVSFSEEEGEDWVLGTLWVLSLSLDDKRR